MLSVCVCSLFQLSFQHKVGVLYCKAGQSTEEEMYNNEGAGPALEEFLDLLGQRVRLKGFTKYRAQLDNKSKIKKHSVPKAYIQLIQLSAGYLIYCPLVRKSETLNDLSCFVFQRTPRGRTPSTPPTRTTS